MRVTILGGGVNGITTGLLLSALGARCTIVTDRRADRREGPADPFFASLYPAASVIPHAVHVDDVVTHMQETQAFFEVLRQHGTFGVRRQMHFEVFEAPRPDPAYAPAMHDFRRLCEDEQNLADAPRRPGADALYGWTFQTYFAETPTYLQRLFDVFESTGGQVHTRRLRSQEDVADLPGDAIVNCLGAGSRTLFADPAPHQFLEGRLVYAPVARPALHTRRGEICSYNYTPTPEVYRRPDGSPGGLYVYPRSDVWVIGGTKRPVDPESGHRHTPEAEATVCIDGIDIPEPVVTVNAEILAAMYGTDIRDTDLRAASGLRFVRDLDEAGVRLEAETFGGRPVVHNYGHGGAGVTLSWSSALRVARLLRRHGLAGAVPSDDRTASASPPGPDVRSALAETARTLGIDSSPTGPSSCSMADEQ